MPQDVTPTDADARHERAALEQARDARATRLFFRLGIGAVVVLLIWILVVVASFAR